MVEQLFTVARALRMLRSTGRLGSCTNLVWTDL